MLYDCARCKDQPALYQLLGHDGPPQGIYRENLLTRAPLAECPLRTILRGEETNPGFARELTRYTEHYLPAYSRGMLVNDGGIGSQPARYLALIRELENAEAASEYEFVRLQSERDKHANGGD